MKTDSEGMNIVCVGNSHLASFSKALIQKNQSYLETATLKFWPVQYMSDSWSNFNANSFLFSPTFLEDNPIGLPSADKIIGSNTVLVLVGLGISGNAIFTHFGKLIYANPNEMLNGHSCSPLMPIIYDENINEKSALSHMLKRGAACYSLSMCSHLFSYSIKKYLNKIKLLCSQSSFKYVYCVPAPNMPERVARWRLGQDYCNSGVQKVINCLYRKKLNELIIEMGLVDNIILHDISLENDLGFIYDQYANSDALNDNHVNEHYYEHIAFDLFNKQPLLKRKPL